MSSTEHGYSDFRVSSILLSLSAAILPFIFMSWMVKRQGNINSVNDHFWSWTSWAGPSKFARSPPLVLVSFLHKDLPNWTVKCAAIPYIFSRFIVSSRSCNICNNRMLSFDFGFEKNRTTHDLSDDTRILQRTWDVRRCISWDGIHFWEHIG